MNQELSKYELFAVFGLLFLGLGFLGLFLTLSGFFYTFPFYLYLFCSGSFFLYLGYRNRQILAQNKNFFWIIFASLLVVIAFSSFTFPTIFSGRDQGSLSEAAIRLSQNHQLAFSTPASQEFFKIYGPGKAFNFPGFNYTNSGELITSFPLGYVSWLAIFYSLFGLKGLVIANTVTFFVFLLSFFLLSRYYLGGKLAIFGWILTVTSFLFSWFFKFTLSENLALSVLWLGLLFFVLFWKESKKIYLLVSLVSFSFLIFIRIEGLAFLAIAIFILIFRYKNIRYFFQEILGKKLTLLFSFLFIIFLINIKINWPFYVSFAKGFLGAFHLLRSDNHVSSSWLENMIYLFRVLGLYAILDYVILSLVGFFYLLKTKKYFFLWPFIIILPSFIYLLNPSISMDHPWMLRRFVFAVFPAAILYTLIFLTQVLRQKVVLYFFLVLLVLGNLMVFVPFLSIKENTNLLSEMTSLSRNFQENDLILVDREASGNPWAMISGPLDFLSGKQAAYFFNPYDIDKIDRQRFNQIYFIIPDDNLDFYQKNDLLSRLIPEKDYVLHTNSLDIMTKEKNSFPESSLLWPIEQKQTIYGKIYRLRE